jgi:hypothetical protein
MKAHSEKRSHVQSKHFVACNFLIRYYIVPKCVTIITFLLCIFWGLATLGSNRLCIKLKFVMVKGCCWAIWDRMIVFMLPIDAIIAHLSEEAQKGTL